MCSSEAEILKRWASSSMQPRTESTTRSALALARPLTKPRSRPSSKGSPEATSAMTARAVTPMQSESTLPRPMLETVMQFW